MSISAVIERDGKTYFIMPGAIGGDEVVVPRGFLGDDVLDNIITDEAYIYKIGYGTNFWGYSKLFSFDPNDVIDNRR